MLRFTIRDLLWLMVVVGLLLVIVVGYVSRARMELDIAKFKYDRIVRRDSKEVAYQQEILKLSGKSVVGFYYKIDPKSLRTICEIEFADEPQSSSAQFAAGSAAP